MLSSVSLTITNNAVLRSPMVSRDNSSVLIKSRTSPMSNGESLAPQLTNIDLAVLTAANCQGFFNHFFKKISSFINTLLLKYS